MKAKILIDREVTVGDVDDRLFGSFIEHLGRAVYGGIFEPDHPRADSDGFRGDVLELVRELDVPLVRYPGGSFVSSFNWEDSVGPVTKRPRMLDLAWRSTEPNIFGLNEFVKWAKAAKTEVMCAFNLGTRGIDDARNLLEYCNHPGGSYWSDLRKNHGAEEPYGIRLLCLGNEMDHSRQVGQKTADEYGKLANEVGKSIRLFDPNLELIVCGSSTSHIQTFPEWEAVVLDRCYETIDFISLHNYFTNKENDLPTFLGSSVDMDQHIKKVIATCDYAKAKKRSKKTMYLSFDEWNVWFHSEDADCKAEPWQVGPPLLEDVYNLEDALVVGCLLISLLKNADRVKIACMAQLVNVLAPIMTENGGPAWRQTIFYPFMHASRYGRGTVLDIRLDCPRYETAKYGSIPYVEAAAVTNRAGDELTIFAVNRSPKEPIDIDTRIVGFEQIRAKEHVLLSHPDVKAANTRKRPNEVLPRSVPDDVQIEGGSISTRLPPLSWNVIRLGI